MPRFLSGNLFIKNISSYISNEISSFLHTGVVGRIGGAQRVLFALLSQKNVIYRHV